jgi:flavin reductase (DIM6/NTAB) family NADH-FMN oxidoreductase RutF
MLEETDYCGLVSGRKVDKSKLFEIFYGKLSTAPMIKKCPLCLECRLLKVQEFPTNDLFIGEIVAAYSEEAYMTDGQLDLQKMDPLLLTMPDNRYWKTGLFAGQAWGAGRKLLRS